MGAGGGTAQLLHSDLAVKLDQLIRAPTKPQQKLWGLKNVVLPPAFLPTDERGGYERPTLKNGQGHQEEARKILHLPKDTPLGYIHAASVDGGLGVPSLVTRIPRLKKDLLQRLRDSEDPDVRTAVDASGEEGEGEARTSPTLRKKAEREKWSRQLYESVDGSGLRCARQTPASSKWIDDGTLLLKGGDFVRGVKLRGNLMGTKTRSSRGRRVDSVLCDTCRNHPESLGHIMQQSLAAHQARVGRHNNVMARRCWILYQERANHPNISRAASTRYHSLEAGPSWLGN